MTTWNQEVSASSDWTISTPSNPDQDISILSGTLVGLLSGVTYSSDISTSTSSWNSVAATSSSWSQEIAD